MNTPSPATYSPWANYPPPYTYHFGQNVVIPIAVFAFVFGIVLIKIYFNFRRQQLWHETARLALEKGQPLPAGLPTFGGCGSRGNRMRRAWFPGIIWLSAGAGMYCTKVEWCHRWAPLPLCVGGALVVAGLIANLIKQPSEDKGAASAS